MEPAPTEREVHQLAARAAALDEVAVIYRAVHAQRASYPTDSEAYRALSHVLDLLHARRGDSGGQPAEASRRCAARFTYLKCVPSGRHNDNQER